MIGWLQGRAPLGATEPRMQRKGGEEITIKYNDGFADSRPLGFDIH